MRVFKLDRGRLCAIACTLNLGAGLPWDSVAEAVSGVGGVKIVLFRREFAVGPAHLLAAVDYAARAFRTGRNIARSFHVEAFLFAATTNEIAEALRMFQPSSSDRSLHAVIVADEPQRCTDALEALKRVAESVEPLSRDEAAAKRAIRELGIDERELRATRASSLAEAVEKCILSRMAMALVAR